MIVIVLIPIRQRNLYAIKKFVRSLLGIITY